MANYSCVSIPESVTADSFLCLLKNLLSTYGNKATITTADFLPETGYSHVWLVKLPAHPGMVGKNKNIFSIQFKPGELAFRHGPEPHFIFWFRGVVTEMIAKHFDTGVSYDASDKYYKYNEQDPDRFGHPTYHDYLVRHMPKPLSRSDLDEIDFYKKDLPEGWQ